MANLNPTVRWARSRPELLHVDLPAPDLSLVLAPYGSHLVLMLTVEQARVLCQGITATLDRAEGGAS